MKISRNTREQLIIDYTPWFWGLFMVFFTLTFAGAGLALLANGELIGLLFAGFGAGMGILAFGVFVRRVQVILDRPNGILVIRRRTVSGYSEVVHQLAELECAILEETAGSKGGRLYRPTLVLAGGMSAGRHPIVESYTNTGGPRRLAEAVNTWLPVDPRRVEILTRGGTPPPLTTGELEARK